MNLQVGLRAEGRFGGIHRLYCNCTEIGIQNVLRDVPAGSRQECNSWLETFAYSQERGAQALQKKGIIIGFLREGGGGVGT